MSQTKVVDLTVDDLRKLIREIAWRLFLRSVSPTRANMQQSDRNA